MKLSQVPNFRTEDFQSQQSWISRLFVNLNPFIQAVNQVLDQNIDFGTNIKSVTKTYEITTFQEFSFTWPYDTISPVDLRIVNATKGSQKESCILLASWEFDQSESLITVNELVEVSSSGVSEASGTYSFTLRATV